MTKRWDIIEFINREREQRLDAYRSVPADVEDHAIAEEQTARGGYNGRQVHELVQNALDAALSDGGAAGRIEVHFDGNALYVANSGAGFDEDGVRALLLGNSSPKRGNEIGRFGIGFKSITGITDTPLIVSGGEAFSFDRKRSAADIARATGRDFAQFPLLRLAYGPSEDPRRDDWMLAHLTEWAETVVHVPLKDEFAQSRVLAELNSFDGRFLLFADGAIEFRIVCSMAGTEFDRTWTIDCDGERATLTTGGETQLWFRATRRVELPSDRSVIDDAGDTHVRTSYPIHWATPLDAARVTTGHLWLVFPMDQPSVVPGILNAPWKTDTSRQKVLDGAFNRWLLGEAAHLVCDSIPRLATPDDPGARLDYFPRSERSRENDSATRHLREALLARLSGDAIVPAQDGAFRVAADLNLHPATVIGHETARRSLTRWSCHVSDPKDWLHISGATRDRQARVAEVAGYRQSAPRTRDGSREVLDWIDALDASTANGSITAIQLAAEHSGPDPLVAARLRTEASIILCEDGNSRAAADVRLTLGTATLVRSGGVVHGEVAATVRETLKRAPFRVLEEDLRDTAEGVFRRIELLAHTEGWAKGFSQVCGDHLKWINALPRHERQDLLDRLRTSSVRVPLPTENSTWVAARTIPPPSEWHGDNALSVAGCELNEEDLERLCAWYPSEARSATTSDWHDKLCE